MWWTTIVIFSVLVTTQPEYDGTLWRVYPGNQRYFHKNADAVVAMTIGKPLPQEKPKENAASAPVAVEPAKKSPVAKPNPAKAALESSFVQKLKKLVSNKQLNQEAKKIGATNTLTPASVTLPAKPKKEIVIQYNTNIFRLTADQKKEIASLLDEFKRADQIHIDGYADMTGSARYNLILTQKRAKEVKKALIALGIDQKRITARGLGQTNILPRGQNSRRTEIRLKNGHAKK
jgi:outer membrane protein OmpA-like peptidoglycan-associated protein